VSLWTDIRASYTPDKRQWDRLYPWLAYVLRPLSFPLTWAAARAGLSADAVTGLSALSAVLGCAAFMRGWFLSGALLLVFYNLLDCVDGNLARLGRGSGPAGKFLDALATYPYWFSYLFLGAGLFYHPDAAMARWPAWLRGDCLLASGGLATAAVFAGQLAKVNFWAMLEKPWEEWKAGQGGAPASVTQSSAYKIYLNLTELQGHEALLLVAAACGAPSLFLVYSLLAAGGSFLLTCVLYVRRARRFRAPS